MNKILLYVAIAVVVVAAVVFALTKGKKSENNVEPMKNSAIVVVDELYDFIDGTLACQGADSCVLGTAALLQSEAAEGTPILFIADHHPANHCSFAEQGGPWPLHCVAGTRGGEIADALKGFVEDSLTFFKGTDPAQEQYSGFEGRNAAGQTLDEVLKLLGVGEVTVVGIATEYCVRNTAEDLLKAGYKISIPESCLAWVDRNGHEDAVAAMKAEGIVFLK